ncbi:AraC family transcriptional regulator [Paenibacillus bouchesdurhonensis]|uniref:AraC family transcriptional regulator n=1 Tax=Paenibacillus bouchesdurhonensis TaxID=1870990 RepID=UPI000DA63737|nr:AraC family transcriptional regulator [Paenibacillus bouchesdurhonensis]
MLQETYSAAANPEVFDESDLHILFAGESQTRPDHRVGPKVYDYYLLHFVEEGTGSFQTEYSIYELQPGDGFLILPNQLVSYASDIATPWRYRWIAFTGAKVPALLERAGLTPQHPVIHTPTDSSIPQLLLSVLQEFRSKKPSSHLYSLGCLHLIMAEAEDSHLKESTLPSGESAVQKIVKQMIYYISSQYAHHVSIEEMCASLGYNRAYLSRIFKKETGLTPVTYLLKLRIDKSRQLLRERPELSIEQIASSVGLNDALYFSRQFRRFHGQSPSEYRRSAPGK